MEIEGRSIPGLTLDSLYMLANKNHYTGKTGCTGLLSEIVFNEAYIQLTSTLFESDRLLSAKKIVSTRCLLTDQLGKVLDLFEFDDTRLGLVISAKQHIFDVDRLPSLKTKFGLAQNQEKFLQLIADF